MIDTGNFKNSTIRYKHEGSGTVVVLIHGYLESLNIWNKFSNELSKKFSVISIDLPGHGQSDIVADVHTMEIMAEDLIFGTAPFPVTTRRGLKLLKMPRSRDYFSGMKRKTSGWKTLRQNYLKSLIMKMN